MPLRRTTLVFVLSALAGSLLGVASAAPAGATVDPPPGATVRVMRFPVEGPVSYHDDFGDPRNGHLHQGNDLLGEKMQRLLAAADATITWMRHDASGNLLILTDAEGWEYWYIHINNDTPGTDDGANLFEYAFAPGMAIGVRVFAGQHVAFLGDSGNAEAVTPHLHFELHPPGTSAISPYWSLQMARTEPDPDDIVLGGGIWPSSEYPQFMLRNSPTAGAPDISLNYGINGDRGLACDWDGNGTDTLAIRRGDTFHLRNSNTPGGADITIRFGNATDVPVCGDWNGDGVDTIGLWRNGHWYLRNANTAGRPDIEFRFGNANDKPLVGDWNGDGADSIGAHRKDRFILRNSNSAGPADLLLVYGAPTDRPVMGDWNGDGIDTLGIERNGSFYLRNTNTQGFANLTFAFGSPADVPIAGDWNGNLTDTPGRVRYSA